MLAGALHLPSGASSQRWRESNPQRAVTCRRVLFAAGMQDRGAARSRWGCVPIRWSRNILPSQGQHVPEDCWLLGDPTHPGDAPRWRRPVTVPGLGVSLCPARRYPGVRPVLSLPVIGRRCRQALAAIEPVAQAAVLEAREPRPKSGLRACSAQGIAHIVAPSYNHVIHCRHSSRKSG